MSEEPEIPTSFVAPSIEELSPLFPAYEIEAFIAQGGMGAVYKATQKSLDRAVAIKILPREFGEDAQFRSSFEAEAKAMARLNHPNLIGVYDFGDVDGMLFIIMEYVQGKALYYSIHKKAIDPTIALDLISKISRGLGHAHKGGILHRDIKPANILLDIDAEPKVGDFGLARPMDAKRGEGLAFGTPGYTAPEVYSSKDEPIDQRSDIFSVGAILFELVKGRAPEHGATSMKTGFDPRLDAILSKATHADPNQRFSNVEDFANQLDALAPKLSGPRFATATSPTSSLPPAPITELRSSKSSSLPAVAAVALILAGAGFAFYQSQQSDEPEADKAPEVVETPVIEKPTKKPVKKPEPVVEKPAPKKPEMVVKKPEPRPTPQPDPEPEPVKPRENPMNSLNRLQGALLAGNFGELPHGSVKNGDSAYFFYRPSKSWPEASAIAETYGASLATFSTSEELTFLRDSFPSDKTIWLGASDSGLEGKWYWMNGSPVPESLWAKNSPDNDPEASPAGEDFAGLTSEGIEDFSGIASCPAIFEWTLDGSRPGSLDAQLARTAASLKENGTPLFPASSFEFNGSRYLLVKKENNYEQADQFAKKAGGHLAVLSSQEEADHLSGLMRSMLEKNVDCWFGGQRSTEDPERWETPTGEVFAFHKWISENPDFSEGKDTVLEFKNAEWDGGKGFNDTKPDNSSPYLLIEWSHPSLRNMPPAVVDQGPTLEKLEKIREKLRGRHSRDYQRYAKKREKIISDWVKGAINRIEDDRDLPENIKASAIEKLEEYKETQDLPDNLPPATPGKIKRSFKEAKEELSEFWEEYKGDWEDAKSDYREALEEASEDALKEGDTIFLGFIAKEIAAISDDARFGMILGGEKTVGLPE
ncbi:protein kinase [bacterium]|nr:protein kinase [Akkermansiaceae bacterium]MDB4273141.1 protein kinase [Akkermansiaceae bacterium]MDB4283469.1 protein kinase [Akkermansiaceae bacterium]MDB4296015.1 protein kinase [bacterium]MDB4796367.1 protein kinase [Akkermansiaceae bacterium]